MTASCQEILRVGFPLFFISRQLRLERPKSCRHIMMRNNMILPYLMNNGFSTSRSVINNKLGRCESFASLVVQANPVEPPILYEDLKDRSHVPSFTISRARGFLPIKVRVSSISFVLIFLLTSIYLFASRCYSSSIDRLCFCFSAPFDRLAPSVCTYRVHFTTNDD